MVDKLCRELHVVYILARGVPLQKLRIVDCRLSNRTQMLQYYIIFSLLLVMGKHKS